MQRSNEGDWFSSHSKTSGGRCKRSSRMKPLTLSPSPTAVKSAPWKGMTRRSSVGTARCRRKSLPYRMHPRQLFVDQSSTRWIGSTPADDLELGFWQLTKPRNSHDNQTYRYLSAVAFALLYRHDEKDSRTRPQFFTLPTPHWARLSCRKRRTGNSVSRRWICVEITDLPLGDLPYSVPSQRQRERFIEAMKRTTKRAVLLVAVSSAAACAGSTARDEATFDVAPVKQSQGESASGSCGECDAQTKALKSTCDSCTKAVCTHDSYCCKTKWDAQCVKEVSEYCASATCGGSGTGGSSATGGSGGSATGTGGGASTGSGACGECTAQSKALSSSCDACTAAVCAEDSYCCKTKWDAQCVKEVSDYCASATCGGSGTGGSAPTSTTTSAGGGGGSFPTSTTSPTTTTTTTTTTSTGTGGGTPVSPPTLPSPTLPAIELPNLVVGVFGDVRPANPDDSASYPEAIVAGIFSGLESMNIPVTVDVGDHCFQATAKSGGTCHTQLVNSFMAKRALYGGKLLPTLGNHEGCGAEAATAGNCAGTYTGYIIQDFINDVVKPSTGQSSPYYSVVMYGTWGTAKFIHIAANAWDSAGKQSAWVQSSLAVPTTYTFVVRHEPTMIRGRSE